VDRIKIEVLGEGQVREQTVREVVRYGRNDSEEEDGGRGEGSKQYCWKRKYTTIFMRPACGSFQDTD
jgi:hypothetical protein